VDLVSQSSILPNGSYTIASVPTSKNVTITVATSQTTGDHKAGEFLKACRLVSPHGFRYHWGNLVVIAEDKWRPFSLDRIDHIAAWTATGPLSAIGQTTDFEYWKSPARWVQEDKTEFGAILRRSVIDTAGGKVVWAVPGYGCCFQADIYSKDLIAGDQLVTALGMPKGELFVSGTDATGTFDWGNISSITSITTTATIELQNAHGQAGPTFQVDLEHIRGNAGPLLNGTNQTATVTSATSFTVVASGTLTNLKHWGGNARLSPAGSLLGHAGATHPAGNYYVGCAYRSETGEIGLVSKVREIEAPGEFIHLQIVAALPRECLREAPVETDILVFVGRSPDGMELVGSFAGSGSSGRGVIGGTDLQVFPPIPSEEPKRTRIPKLEQMPMGAKWLRHMRATTFFGGTHGETGAQFQLVPYDMTAQSEFDLGPVDFVTIDSQGFVGGKILPSSYQGVEVSNPPAASVPSRATLEELSSLLNLLPDPLHCYLTSEKELTSSSTANVLLPKGHVWFSERDHPGVAPSINRMIVDSEVGLDVEAAGRFSDNLILCTNAETFVASYGRSPLGTDPRLVSDEHGCVAPRSMVEFDDGLAWIGSRGPVAITGAGLQWIGRPIYEDWSGQAQTAFCSLSSDSHAMMHHAFSSHDPDRGLVWFGGRLGGEDEYDDASDDDKTLFGCNFFYLWSYRTNSWSTWTPPSWLGDVYDMDRCFFDDGTWKLCFMAGDPVGGYHIHALDDAYGEGTSQVFSYTLQGNGTSAVVLTNENISSEIVAGMSYAIFNQTQGLKSEGTIVSINRAPSTADLVTLSESLSWLDGDNILFGDISMSLETCFMSFDELDKEFEINCAETRHHIDSLTPDGVAKVSLENQDGASSSVEVSRYGYTRLDTYRTSLRGAGLGRATEAKVIIDLYPNAALSLRNVGIGVRGA
jgi:hypothetical protein